MSGPMLSITLASPPPGAVNVQYGTSIEGPGGRWVPCATRVANGHYCSSLFEVGPGKRQICAVNDRFDTPEAALTSAISLASTAAG